MTADMGLPGDTVVVRTEGLLTAEVDGELMAMSIEQGVCYGLDRVGTRVWALIAAPRSVDSLCEALLQEFDVDAEKCRREVVELLQDLRAEGLASVRIQ